MATCSIVTTPTAPANLEAYREHEQFYGIGSHDNDDLHVSEHLPSSDSDEDELGGTDTESEAALRAFDGQSDTNDLMITNMSAEWRLMKDHMQLGCGYSFDCYKQFTDDEVFHKHLKDNGIILREDGNKGRLPPNAFTFDTTKNIVDFITNYATVFGLPQQAARRGRASTPPVFLPASEGYNTVHHKYVEACVASGKQAAKDHSFHQIWLVCATYPIHDTPYWCLPALWELSSKALTEGDKLTLTQQFKKHVDLAQKEHQYYLDSMKQLRQV